MFQNIHKRNAANIIAQMSSSFHNVSLTSKTPSAEQFRLPAPHLVTRPLNALPLRGGLWHYSYTIR